MNLSRFFGSTNREVLRQVRLALGPDALIVSNRRVNGGVEILAADATSLSVQASDLVSVDALSSPAAAQVARPAGAPEPNVMDAIGAMRGALETRIDELLWGSQLRRVPQTVSLFQILLGHGFSTALLRAMLKRLPERLSSKAALDWARNELITHLPILQHEDDLWMPGVALALVGPTGVGKTTTIAKLAARCAKRVGPRNLVLLTTDTYRIGAHEQLKIYGQMMQIAVHVVQDGDELRRIVRELGPDQVVLIDNTGISQRDRYITEQASMLAGAGRPVKRILVLSASSNGDTLDEVARSYCDDGGSPLAGCIITKLDEATRLGAALDTAVRYQLPINYVSNGQKVPEDLLFSSAADLVDQALARPQQERSLYAATEADFAALMSLVKNPDSDLAVAMADDRRKQLLPDLLAAVGGASFSPPVSKVKNACAYLDDNPACSEAFDLWRAYTTSAAPTPSDAPIEATIQHLVRAAQNHLARADCRYVLASHDTVPLKSQTDVRGHLRATALLTEHGQALITPMQQLAFADGWRSSCGAAALAAPRSNDALHHQIQWLNQQCRQLPLVHMFDNGTPALWRRLSLQGSSWLAQCSGAKEIEVDSCPTTLAAVAKTLTYRPVALLAQSVQLAEFHNSAISESVFWLGSVTVMLPARQVGPLSLQLISVRVVSRRDGAPMKTFYGLSNLPPAQVKPDQLAAWLVAQYDVKVGFRYAAAFWQLLGQRGHPAALQNQALTAMQAGLAAWQIKRATDAHEVRAILHGLAGRPLLTAQATASAVLKLFVLKEMLA